MDRRSFLKTIVYENHEKLVRKILTGEKCSVIMFMIISISVLMSTQFIMVE